MVSIKTHYPLQTLNTFNVQAHADLFCEVSNTTELEQLLTQPESKTNSTFILGGGSNVLLTKDIHGLVIKNSIQGIKLVDENETHVWLRVGAGENWHQFVLYCLQHGYAGVENLSLIPGTVGAAPIQNIGAYGVEIKDIFESLEATHLSSGEKRVFTHGDCQFGYRDSIFKGDLKNQYIITTVTFKLCKQATPNTSYGAINSVLHQWNICKPTINDISNAVIHIRQQKLPDPQKLANAGSFFKNPIIASEQFHTLQKKYPDIPHYDQPQQQQKIPAAWLIDQCQLKGFKRNGVGVSPDHALVLVNYSSHDGSAIVDLAHDIQQRVEQRFGIYLETEVNII